MAVSQAIQSVQATEPVFTRMERVASTSAVDTRQTWCIIHARRHLVVDDVLGGVIRMRKLTDLAGKSSFAMTLTATPENRQAVILVYTSV